MVKVLTGFCGLIVAKRSASRLTKYNTKKEKMYKRTKIDQKYDLRGVLRIYNIHVNDNENCRITFFTKDQRIRKFDGAIPVTSQPRIFVSKFEV